MHMPSITYEIIDLKASNPVSPQLLQTALCVIRCLCGGYLLQLRDDKEGIWFPGMWGTFGGSLDPGELPAEAMLRELKEELALELRIDEVQLLCYLLHKKGKAFKVEHIFYAKIEVELDELQLLEGQQMACISKEDIISGEAFSSLLQEKRSIAGPILYLFQALRDL